MFQSAERYKTSLSSGALVASQHASQIGRRARVLGQDAGAKARVASQRALLDAGTKAQVASQRALQMVSDIKFEKPDTSCFALVGTALNLLNGTTGPGLLALPLAFSRCGWVMGSLLLVLVFSLNYVSLHFLLKACLAAREHSYIGLSGRTSDSVAALVDWASLLFFFGSCVSYLVIIGDAFNLVTARGGDGGWYRAVEGEHYARLALLLLLGFTACCLLPLSLLRSMDSLQPTSAVAMVCIVYTVAVVVCTSALPAEAAAEAALSRRLSEEAGGYPAAGGAQAFELSSSTLLSLPTMAFCFSSQSLFPPALETLHQPATYHHLHTVVDSTMALTLVLHLLIALGGYLRHGDAVEPNILDALPQSTAVSVARLAIVCAFAFTYPMMIFLCRMHIGAITARRARLRSSPWGGAGPAEEAEKGADETEEAEAEQLGSASEAFDVDEMTSAAAEITPPAKPFGGEDDHVVVTGLLVSLSLVAAFLFPNIDQLFGLLGGTTAVVISFVAPALFWEKFVGFMYPWHHPRKLFCQALFLFSALIASLSLPMLVVNLLGDLYATTWWVPMADAGLQQWPGGWAVESTASKAWLAHSAARPTNASRAAAALATPALHAAAAAAANAAQLATKATRAHGSGAAQGVLFGPHLPPHHHAHGLLNKLAAPRTDERPRGAASQEGDATRAAGR